MYALHILFALFRLIPSAMSCFTNVFLFISSILLCCIPVWSSRYPYLFAASVTDSAFSPLAFAKAALAAQWHCGHFLSAGWAVIGDVPRIGALPARYLANGAHIPQWLHCGVSYSYTIHLDIVRASIHLRPTVGTIVASPERETFPANNIGVFFDLVGCT